MAAHRVIILGGGFGGLYAARALGRARVEVTLLDRRNFHLFQPLMYQVATGSLSPGEISAPLRSILSRQKNTRVLLGEAADLDPKARRVVLRDGGSFAYDSLIVATGSETSYFGQDQWREWAPSLKTIEEATAIRHKILYAFEAAERTSDADERRAWLTFAIVGGGATGVELAGALGEIARAQARLPRHRSEGCAHPHRRPGSTGADGLSGRPLGARGGIAVAAGSPRAHRSAGHGRGR